MKELPSDIAILKDEIAIYEEKVRLEEEHIARSKSLIEHEIRNRNELFHRYMPDRKRKRELLNRYAEKIRFKQFERHMAKEDLKRFQEKLSALKERLAALETSSSAPESTSP